MKHKRKKAAYLEEAVRAAKAVKAVKAVKAGMAGMAGKAGEAVPDTRFGHGRSRDLDRESDLGRPPGAPMGCDQVLALQYSH